MEGNAAAAAAPAPLPPPASYVEEFKEGVRVQVKTVLGDEFSGEVLTFDWTADCVVLQGAGSASAKWNLHFVKVPHIKDVQVLGGRPREAAPDLRIPLVDMGVLRTREEAALRQADAEAERIGVNVTREAQDLFDALAKTLPVRWDKAVIVVMDEVRVNPPYTPESVVGGQSSFVERVRKVLEYERKRLVGRP